MEKIQFRNSITRKGTFDSGHRVMNERFKCFNIHGHTYLYELTFSWIEAKSIGYAVDFKEIKRVACEWIDERLDHGFIANPKDTSVVELCREIGTKLYLMHMTDERGYCNPSAENIAKEIFFAVSHLMNRDDETQFKLDRIKLYETPNCFVECSGLSKEEEDALTISELWRDCMDYRIKKGAVEYDDRQSEDRAD